MLPEPPFHFRLPASKFRRMIALDLAAWPRERAGEDPPADELIAFVLGALRPHERGLGLGAV